jgi:DNA-binding transcriptional regulator YdaS (Cro superfamily)
MSTGIDALRRAKEILGTEQAIADVVGCSQPNVHQVLKRGTQVPAEWCIPLEHATAATGQRIPRAAFRPDIYPNESVAHGSSSPRSRGRNRKPAEPRQADQKTPNPRAQAANA